MNELENTIKQLSDADFLELKTWVVTTETDRRAATPIVEEARKDAQAEVTAEVAKKLAEKDTKLKPPAKPSQTPRTWKPWHPLDTTTHFYGGDLCTHGGKTWRDMVDDTRTQPNVWEPGSVGIDERYWQEVVEQTDEETPATPTPAAKEPDGSKDNPLPFKAGLQLTAGQHVTYQGATYKVIQGHTSADHWAPPNAPSLFTKAS